MIGSYFVGNAVYSLLDAGLANVLCVQTLRHGTNPINNLRIRVTGGDPSHGNKLTGATKDIGFLDDTRGYFYVFKDSEMFDKGASIEDVDFFKTNSRLINRIVTTKGILNRCLPRVFTALSGYNIVAPVFSKLKYQSKAIKCLRVFIGILGGTASCLIAPTIRFRFSQIDPMRLETDPRLKIAYRTKQAVEPWRIGLLGTLLTGVNKTWPSRVKAHPRKFLTGVVQLTVAIAITILCVHILIANPLLVIPAIVGALLA